MENKKKTASRVTLWAIWAIALVPVAAASLAYTLDWPLTQGRTNQGELQSPVLTLNQWGGSSELYTGHWTLLVKPEQECRQPCQTQVERLKAIHDALGRDSTRLRVHVAETESLAVEQGVWLIDPNGNLVLKYRPELIGKPLLKDLKRLLKASQLG
ncbi:hypothetical protein [Marinobacterium mangrovicola]|uniref:Transmembrane cytochrome oxidase associated protein n=1 Tax=Marinobacterium mangrovicola TaxID=1476959 RepID=A0A4V2PCR2_9GAMM|nr:hypothetical protein [Marinobacterium mangrovicola]TCK02256.1 hypothetical protein CLV83_4438 [Marinobacterium mangrovicola]